MTTEDDARRVYDEAVVIDGLNVSKWESEAVYRSLHAGRVTAINATVAIWEGFRETMDNIARWPQRFAEHSDTLVQARTAGDIVQAKKEGRKDGRTAVILGMAERSAHRERPGPAGAGPLSRCLDSPGHVQRAQPARQRVLRAHRRRVEQFWPGRDTGDERARDPDRPLPRWRPDNAGHHRGLRAARGVHPRERQVVL